MNGVLSFIWDRATKLCRLVAMSIRPSRQAGREYRNWYALLPLSMLLFLTTQHANAVPKVNLTGPISGQTFIAGSTVAISSTATDTTAPIAYVKYYSDSTFLGYGTVAPSYSINVPNFPAGSHNITAVATNTADVSASSSLVAITVAPILTTISLTQPYNGQAFTAGSALPLSATLANTGGHTYYVEYFWITAQLGYANPVPLRVNTAAPSYSDNIPSLPAGNFSIFAVATDTATGVSIPSAPISINVCVNTCQTNVAGVPLTVPTTRDPLVSPFAETSIWNTPIGSGAVYVPAQLSAYTNSADANINNWGAPMPQIDQDIIVLQPTAPLVTVAKSSVQWKGGDRCVPDTPLTVIQSVPVPSGFLVPNGPGNNSAAFLASDGRTIQQSQPFTLCTSGGEATAYLDFPSVDLYGQGVTGAHGGSKLSAIGGTLRIGELRPGGQPPRHALKIDIDTTNFLHPCSVISDCYRWPAIAADHDATSTYGTASTASPNIPLGMKMGALLAIPQSVDLTTIGLETKPAQMLAWTLQNYGAYIVDSSGLPAFGIAAENGPQGSMLTQFQNDWCFAMQDWVIHATTPTRNQCTSTMSTNPWVRDMQRLVVLLNLVDNNKKETPGGGGAPLQPFAPPLSVPN